MEYVSTVKEDTWLLSNTSTVANGAEVIGTLLESPLWWLLVNAFLLETWKAILLTSDTFTRVATREHLGTGLLHEVKTFLLSAYVTEGWLHTWGWLFELVSTESAAFGLILCTSLTYMIWLSIALNTEVLSTLIAPYSIVCHMSSGFLR